MDNERILKQVASDLRNAQLLHEQLYEFCNEKQIDFATSTGWITSATGNEKDCRETSDFLQLATSKVWND